MIRRSLIIASTLLAIACVPAAAHTVTQGDLALSDLEVRASLGVNPNTGGYMVVDNKGEADVLVGASCTCAKRVELHTMSHDGGVMRMNKVDSFAVPARGRLALRPGGNHLMLMGTKGQLKAGTEVRMTLKFRRAGTVTANFHVVTAPKPAAADPHAGH